MYITHIHLDASIDEPFKPSKMIQNEQQKNQGTEILYIMQYYLHSGSFRQIKSKTKCGIEYFLVVFFLYLLFMFVALVIQWIIFYVEKRLATITSHQIQTFQFCTFLLYFTIRAMPTTKVEKYQTHFMSGSGFCITCETSIFCVRNALLYQQ